MSEQVRIAAGLIFFYKVLADNIC